MSNATNAITALQNLKSVVTAVEAGIRTGNVEIDAETLRLLTTRDDLFMQALFNFGSRAQQASAATARAAANNGQPALQDVVYSQIDIFTKAIDAQVAVLTNPTQTPRRSHSTLQ